MTSRYMTFACIALVIAGVAWETGRRGARAYERMLVQRVQNGLEVLGYDWARISADGLQLELHGHAPDMFARELALESARATAPIATVSSFATATLAPPERRDPVRVELLRDQNGITMTGQTASRLMRDELNSTLEADGPTLKIRDLTGIQAAQPRDGWQAEISVASLAAASLPNAYVVIEPGEVLIEGQAPDEATRDVLIDALTELAGEMVALNLKVRIPPRVIAPFVFSAHKDAGGEILVETCATRSEAERTALHLRLDDLGAELMDGDACDLGLGGPGGNWLSAINAGLQALNALPAGRLDAEYRAVRVTAYPPTEPKVFDDSTQSFVETLPEGYKPETIYTGDDVATLTEIARERFWMHLERSAFGVTVSGQVPDREAKHAITAYAAALFGSDALQVALQVVDAGAPSRWQVAAFALLDQLALAEGGDAHLAGHKVEISARLPSTVMVRQIHDELTLGLPEYDISTQFEIDLPRTMQLIPLPAARCADQLSRMNHEQPIDFDTGSAVITKESAGILDDLAGLFKRCTADPIEIGGHTDAQGSEDLNLRLSQARAVAVRKSLMKRGVGGRRITAKGYGESVPIADNQTEEGRARNRRIEFQPAAPDGASGE